MLNTAKGPAVHSLRAQADKRAYQRRMRRALDEAENLTLRQAEVCDIEVSGGRVRRGEDHHRVEDRMPRGGRVCGGVYLNEPDHHRRMRVAGSARRGCSSSMHLGGFAGKAGLFRFAAFKTRNARAPRRPHDRLFQKWSRSRVTSRWVAVSRS